VTLFGLLAKSMTRTEYKTDSRKLDSLILAALRAEDVERALKEGIATKSQIIDYLRPQATTIWDSAISEIEIASTALARTETAKSAADPAFKNLLDEEGKPFPAKIRFIDHVTNYIVFVAAMTLGTILLGILVEQGWTVSLRWLRVWSNIFKLAIVLMFSGLGIFVLKRSLAYARKVLVSELNEKRSAERAKTAKGIRTEYRIPELEQESFQLSQNADTAVVQKGILPLVRVFLNEQVGVREDAPLQVVLPDIPVPGLAEVFNPSYEIPTEAKEQVVRLFDAMPGGSIAIAGPRGAGKSTLLWAICNGSVKEIKDKQVLSISSSAPVKYDPREFILHLFSSVCRQVLRLNKEDDDVAPWRTIGRLKEPTTFRFEALRTVLPTLNRASFIAIFLGLNTLLLSGVPCNENGGTSEARGAGFLGSCKFRQRSTIYSNP
jgi:ABC-type multidrug transport system fused ATPase/permease subunit